MSPSTTLKFIKLLGTLTTTGRLENTTRLALTVLPLVTRSWEVQKSPIALEAARTPSSKGSTGFSRSTSFLTPRRLFLAWTTRLLTASWTSEESSWLRPARPPSLTLPPLLRWFRTLETPFLRLSRTAWTEINNLKPLALNTELPPILTHQ